jgi:hypothetical protein
MQWYRRPAGAPGAYGANPISAASSSAVVCSRSCSPAATRAGRQAGGGRRASGGGRRALGRTGEVEDGGAEDARGVLVGEAPAPGVALELREGGERLLHAPARAHRAVAPVDHVPQRHRPAHPRRPPLCQRSRHLSGARVPRPQPLPREQWSMRPHAPAGCRCAGRASRRGRAPLDARPGSRACCPARRPARTRLSVHRRALAAGGARTGRSAGAHRVRHVGVAVQPHAGEEAQDHRRRVFGGKAQAGLRVEALRRRAAVRVAPLDVATPLRTFLTGDPRRCLRGELVDRAVQST